MVIITPRGEIVKSVISYGNADTPRHDVNEKIVEETDFTSAGKKKHPARSGSLRRSSFVDKGTHVTEGSFTSESRDSAKRGRMR